MKREKLLWLISGALVAVLGLWVVFRPGMDKEKLLQAQREHRAAIDLYLKKDRKGGDEKARGALLLYEEAGALTADLSDLLSFLTHDASQKKLAREVGFTV